MHNVEFDYAGRTINLAGHSEQDWIFKLIKDRKTFYELDLLKYIKYVLRGKKGLILDIGANIGNHSVFFGLFAGRSVASFEPNPELFPILERNLLTNNIAHRIYRFGLGSTNGNFALEIPVGMSNNIGATKLIPEKNGLIEVKKLDQIMDAIAREFPGNRLVAIKADIEGMEAEMVRGALSTLQKYKPDIFLEISTSHAMVEIESLLLPLGYRRTVSLAATPVWHFVHSQNYGLRTRFRLGFYIVASKLFDIVLRLPRKFVAGA